MNRGYPTNLTDNQWQILQKILEPTPRKRKYSLRDIMDCIFYIYKTGCQWRISEAMIQIAFSKIMLNKLSN